MRATQLFENGLADTDVRVTDRQPVIVVPRIINSQVDVEGAQCAVVVQLSEESGSTISTLSLDHCIRCDLRIGTVRKTIATPAQIQ